MKTTVSCVRTGSDKRNGSVLFWVLLLAAVGVGAYIAFGVMKIHLIRDKIDQAMGKKPVTAPRGDEGVLLIHQESLREQDEIRERVANEWMEAQGKMDARHKQIRREIMRAEGEDGADRVLPPGGAAP